MLTRVSRPHISATTQVREALLPTTKAVRGVLLQIIRTGSNKSTGYHGIVPIQSASTCNHDARSVLGDHCSQDFFLAKTSSPRDVCTTPRGKASRDSFQPRKTSSGGWNQRTRSQIAYPAEITRLFYFQPRKRQLRRLKMVQVLKSTR